MTVLLAGSFKVSEFRKAIPDHVKVQAVLLAVANGKLDSVTTDARDLQYDHRPSLCDRPYDLEAGDFIPPQNDPEYIEPITKSVHLHRTTGRKPGAERTVTTRGSDVGERSRIRKIKGTQDLHDLKMACKRGDPKAIAQLLHVERPKKKIQNRGFPKRQRPLRRGKNVAA